MRPAARHDPRPGGSPRPAASPLVQASADPARDAQQLKLFQERVDAYVKLHKKLRGEGPKLADEATPAAIQAHKEYLAKAMRAARASAKPGDLLLPELQPYLRRVLRSELTGPGSAPAREAVKEGNPKVEAPAQPVALKVNAAYPAAAPVSTVPPTILLKLPTLSDEVLEYASWARTWCCAIAVADIIVDDMKGARRDDTTAPRRHRDAGRGLRGKSRAGGSGDRALSRSRYRPGVTRASLKEGSCASPSSATAARGGPRRRRGGHPRQGAARASRTAS